MSNMNVSLLSGGAPDAKHPQLAVGSDLKALELDEIEKCHLILKPNVDRFGNPLKEAKDLSAQAGGLPADLNDPNFTMTMMPLEKSMQHDLVDCPGACKDPEQIESSFFVQPNADHEDPQTIVDRANSLCNGSQSGIQSVIGTLIPPAHIGVYSHNGKTKVMGPGRWQLLHPRTSWLKYKVRLDQEKISVGNLLIIRVPMGKVGLILQNGNAKILNVGTHVFNDGMTSYHGLRAKEEPYIQHGPLHVLRVPRGQFAKVWVPVPNASEAQQCGVDMANVADGTPMQLEGVTLNSDAPASSHKAAPKVQTPAVVVGHSPAAQTGNGASGGNVTVQARLLAEGIHAIQNVLFRYESMVPVSAAYIQHGSANMVQVDKGDVALVMHENLPRLLGQGTHAIESPNFEYKGSAKLADKTIKHGTITIVRVPLGEIGVAWDRNQPHFIDRAGLYAFDSADFTFIKHVSTNERVIELGAKKIIQVYTGEVGISYDHGELRVLQHGRHIIDSFTHLFEGFLSTQQKSIRLATETHEQRRAKRLKMLSQTENGGMNPVQRSKAYDRSQGALLFGESSDGKAAGLSADDLSLSVNNSAGKNRKNVGGKDFHETENSSTMKKKKEEEWSDLMQCETKDLVKVGVRADVFYSIKDPEKAIQTVRVDEIEDLVRETAIATLTNIIRSTALNEIAQSKLPSAVSAEKQREELVAGQAGQASAPPAALFFDKAHDEFLSKLHDDFLSRYGLDIANIRIESFKIMDDELAESISKQALVTAQTENELANLQGKTEIATAEQHRISDVQNIAAEAEARAQKTATDAENQRKIERAKAEAEAQALLVRQQAEAEAQATIIKAKAEAEAVRLVAEAEAERAAALSRTNLGQQQALLQVYADMVSKSNEGVEKVVYCDPTLQQGGGGSAFALPALQNLNRDLHALQGMGLAVTEGVMEGHPGLNLPQAPSGGVGKLDTRKHSDSGSDSSTRMGSDVNMSGASPLASSKQ